MNVCLFSDCIMQIAKAMMILRREKSKIYTFYLLSKYKVTEV